jgi:23S rRNA A2030 N6-methylase RlmJ
MPYDHSTKIGNEGDVVKHIALFAALRHLLQDWSADREFVYADIHAGRPQYVLPEKGDWRSGIGLFSTLEEIKKDRKWRKQGGRTKLGFVGDFDEMIVGRPITIGMIYPGSAGIAFRMLRVSNTRFSMKLWEKDRAAADDSERFFYPWRMRVRTVCDDGYEVVKERKAPSFVLIDPPRIEQATDALRTIQELAKKNIPFLCWMPRTPKSVPPENEEELKAWSSEEAATSTDYLCQAAQHGRCLQILWKRKWGPSPGCSITVSHGMASGVVPAVKQVTELMKWEFKD